MNHLDLFSGIGGFSLAAQWVWGEEHKIVGFCEKDKFCQKILKKHWPGVQIFDDIVELKGEQFEAVDLITGGVPCQPASVAGKRRGTKDDRWLWKQTFEVIRHIKPRFCILENVRGILSLEGGMVFENLLLELESYGYETATFIIPACAVNAPHRRDRVWIIANNKNKRLQRSIKTNGEQRSESNDEQPRRLHREWDKKWTEAATRFCRVDARIPNRIHRLGALGNAIVPQVAYEIMKVMKSQERIRLYCEKEVVRQRSSGQRVDSCCMRSKKIKKRNVVDRICLG